MAVVWMVKEICVGENTSRDTSENRKNRKTCGYYTTFFFRHNRVIIELCYNRVAEQLKTYYLLGYYKILGKPQNYRNL